MKAIIIALAATTLAGATLAPASRTAPAALQSGSYTADSVHSVVWFKTRHVGVSNFYGRVNSVTGDVHYNESDLSQSTVVIEIDASSVDTANQKRDGHLKSPDFLSVKEFPAIRFTSTSVKGTPEGFEVTGELTLHGVTRTVTAEAALIGAGDTPFQDFRAGFEATFTIEPTEFGINFMQKNPKALGPGVELTVSLEAVRQEG